MPTKNRKTPISVGSIRKALKREAKKSLEPNDLIIIVEKSKLTEEILIAALPLKRKKKVDTHTEYTLMSSSEG